MKIKFNKKYEDGTLWTQVLHDFLETLSKAYGYSIDEHDLQRCVWSRRLDVLGKLVDEHRPVAWELFEAAALEESKATKKAAKDRAAYKQTLETLLKET